MNLNIFKGIELWSENEKTNEHWDKFEEKAGVYCFVSAKTDEILYIGESSVNVGDRFNKWFRHPSTEKEKKIAESLSDNDFIIVATVEKHKYMVRAIEAYLLSKFETKFNVKS